METLWYGGCLAIARVEPGRPRGSRSGCVVHARGVARHPVCHSPALQVSRVKQTGLGQPPRGPPRGPPRAVSQPDKWKDVRAGRIDR